jgi:hypothetical protein
VLAGNGARAQTIPCSEAKLTLYLIVLAFLISHGDDQDTEIVFQHKWLIDWRYRPHVHGINSQGEPIVYQAEREAATEFIDQI